ncbi:MAG: four helix bundle protein [Planctomycetes bacterium]|nr:four helix bundle protein [Planctomycetota bacterium]
MDREELKRRTFDFALRVLRLVAALPKTIEGRAVARQLADCGTSVGANYRAVCKARSTAEFIAKLGTVEEESDESAFWLELTIHAELLPKKRVEPLLQEANELTRIMGSSRKTASNRRRG